MHIFSPPSKLSTAGGASAKKAGQSGQKADRAGHGVSVYAALGGPAARDRATLKADHDKVVRLQMIDLAGSEREPGEQDAAASATASTGPYGSHSAALGYGGQVGVMFLKSHSIHISSSFSFLRLVLWSYIF